MDTTQQMIRLQRANEKENAAIARSGAPEEDVKELLSIRSDGRYRGAYDVVEGEKRADILHALFPEEGFGEGVSSTSSAGETGNPPRKRASRTKAA